MLDGRRQRDDGNSYVAVSRILQGNLQRSSEMHFGIFDDGPWKPWEMLKALYALPQYVSTDKIKRDRSMLRCKSLLANRRVF